MFNKKRKATNNDLQFQRNDYTSDEQIPILHKKTIKELIIIIEKKDVEEYVYYKKERMKIKKTILTIKDKN